jgi:uncharacterized protein YneF (UPF0154 family)
MLKIILSIMAGMIIGYFLVKPFINNLNNNKDGK